MGEDAEEEAKRMVGGMRDWVQKKRFLKKCIGKGLKEGFEEESHGFRKKYCRLMTDANTKDVCSMVKDKTKNVKRRDRKKRNRWGRVVRMDREDGRSRGVRDEEKREHSELLVEAL